MRTTSVALMIAAALTACSAPPLQFVPASVGISPTRINAELVSTIVTIAPKTESLGKVDVAGAEDLVADQWKSALDDTLLRSAIFRDGSPRRLTLTVKILKFSYGELGFAYNAVARYELIDRTKGGVIYAIDIHTLGKASDYVGVNRVRNAASRSVQQNISDFIRALESSDINTRLS